MEYILQLAEYKINNSNVAAIQYFKLKDILQSCIKNTPSHLYTNTIYPFTDEKNVFIVYSLSPLQLANHITNTIFEVYNKYVTMSTLLVDKEFIININNENLIYVILFVPVISSKTYILPLSLIKSMVFKKLYNITEYVNIDQDALQILYKKCKKDLILGGASSIKENTMLKQTMLERIYEEIKTHPTIQPNVVFLSYIEELCSGAPIDFTITMNLIVLNETAQQEIIQVFMNMLQNHSGYRIKIAEHTSFYIPNDFRLRKTNIYLQSTSKKMEKIYLCNIYNSGTYEILPCIERFDVLVPSKLVLLRFLYLDLFFIERVPSFSHRIQEKIKKILEIFHDEDGTLVWKGIYKNERSDKINTNLNCKKDLTIYRPWEYFKVHQKLRSIFS